MKPTEVNTRFLHIAISFVAGCVIMLSFTSCGSDKEEEEKAAEAAHRLNRYALVDKIANLYAHKLINMPAKGMAVEEMLMNINSRCQALMVQGDTLTALYFRQMVEDNVRKINATRADSIFGQSPYSAFTIDY